MKQRFFINARGKMEEKSIVFVSTTTGVVGYLFVEDIELMSCTISLQERAIPINPSRNI